MKPPTAPLPLLHRFAIAYLMVPVFIWLAAWFKWWFGLPAAMLLAVALAPALRGPWRPAWPSLSVVAICLIALAWTMLTPHGGLFGANNHDWGDRRYMLLDLTRHPWPTHVQDGLADYLPWGGGERSALLRYYLGWHMVPALAGRLFGAAALNWAVPLWSALGAALVLLLFLRRAAPSRSLTGGRAVLAAGLFVLFSGMDALRILLAHGIGYFQCCELDTLGWPGIRLRFDQRDGLAGVWALYQSTFLSLKSSSQFIGAALYALLLFQLRRRRPFVAAVGVLLAAALFWSPFVAMGLLPLTAVLVCENRTRVRRPTLFSWPNLCLAAPLAGVIALYLTSGAVDFGNRSLWDRYGWQRLAEWAASFFISEFLLLVLVVLALRPRLAREPFFAATVATLLLLPWYRLANINLTLQGSFPALVLLAWFCVHTLLAGAPRRTSAHPTHVWIFKRGMFGVLVAGLAIGAASPIMQIAQSTAADERFRFASSGATLWDLPDRLKRENLAPEVPPVLVKLLRDSGGSAQAVFEPVFRSDFNVHLGLGDKTLVFVNQRCAPDDHRIRVRFVPINPTNAKTERVGGTRRYGAGCGTVIGLPGYPLHAARVGQTPVDGGDWAVDLVFNEAGRFAGLRNPPRCAFTQRPADCDENPTVAALREAHRRVRVTTPSERSHFDVYVDSHWLTLVREPCVDEDIQPRFFLHLVPANTSMLPPGRKATGFDNRDFRFGEHGAVFDGKCVATLRLPYPVVSLRTGQYTATGELWSALVRPSVPSVNIR